MTTEQLNKLPKWAQDHIESIQRQRDQAVKALNEVAGNQSPSPFSYTRHDCTSTGGPTFRKFTIQADTLIVNWLGIELRVDAHDYGNQGKGIRLQWTGEHQTEDVAMIPSSYQAVALVPKSLMR